MSKLNIFEVYDEDSNKSLMFIADSLEQAECIAETVNFNDWNDGDTFYNKTNNNEKSNCKNTSSIP